MINALPTDNLYKAITILSIAIILAVITGMYHGKDAVNEAQLEYQKQYTMLEIEGASQASLDRYSQFANAYIESMQSWRKSSFELAITIILISMFILGYGAAGWKHEQDRQDKINDQTTT